MNAADVAIEEIRAVCRAISAEYGHDVAKYLTALREVEKKYPDQIKRGQEILARRKAERAKYPSPISGDTLVMRERPKSENE